MRGNRTTSADHEPLTREGGVIAMMTPPSFVRIRP